MQHTFNSIKEVINFFEKRSVLFDISKIYELKDVSREIELEALINEPAVDNNQYELLTPQYFLKVSNLGHTIWSGNINPYLKDI